MGNPGRRNIREIGKTEDWGASAVSEKQGSGNFGRFGILGNSGNWGIRKTDPSPRTKESRNQEDWEFRRFGIFEDPGNWGWKISGVEDQEIEELGVAETL